MTKKYIIGISRNGDCSFVRKDHSEHYMDFDSYKKAKEEIDNNMKDCEGAFVYCVKIYMAKRCFQLLTNWIRITKRL